MTLGVADRLALADLVHLYAAAVDDRRFDDVAQLFTDGAELHLPHPPRALEPVRVVHGRSGVREALDALAGVHRTEHALVGEVYVAAPDPGYALGRVTCVAHHWTRRDAAADGPVGAPVDVPIGAPIDDVVWHLRYDDEYLRTPQGWRIHGRAVTINAIERRPVSRLRAVPAAHPAAAVDSSASSTEPLRRRATRPGRLRGTP
ncbi:nuclear transport factor 2 family protein [Mycolicibacterium grossiae]|nr:nuclear transport factor 2 family protein [Mycolicibacterium grossiae]